MDISYMIEMYKAAKLFSVYHTLVRNGLLFLNF